MLDYLRIRCLRIRSLWISFFGAVIALLAAATATSLAQQSTAVNAPSTTGQRVGINPNVSWAWDRPPQGSPLVPVPDPVDATPADQIPLDSLKLPPGFTVSIWASGIPNARSMTMGAKGTVFVGNRSLDKVYAVVDKGDHREVKVIASELHVPNGVAFHDGSLYIAQITRVIRIDDIEDNLDKPPPGKVIYADLPSDEPHGWKFIAFGPDGKLYIPIGAPCNICDPPATHAQIRRINPDGTGMEVVARGVRNSVGFDWDPVTKDLWFTDNGRDWMGDDVPSDRLNHVTKIGEHFGYPYFHAAGLNDSATFIPDPVFGKGKNMADYTPAVAKMGPHVAALGMRFYTGSMFPPEYKNSILICEHGSWNRSVWSGYRIVQVILGKNGAPPEQKVFAEGFRKEGKLWGRPVDVQVMPDGAVLVSDDYAGAIYRIAYKGT
jgi:glucose/arabinose dehydrogenase